MLIIVILIKNMYQSNANVKDLVNVIFQYSLVPIVNKHTRVNKKQRDNH